MKGLIFIFTFVVAANAASIESTYTGSASYSLNDNIKQALERLRDDMPYRDPPLDPLFIEHRDVDYTFADILKLAGTFDDITIKGLSDFEVISVRFVVVFLTLEVELSFKSIKINGKYDIDGALADIIPAYGNGSFVINTDGLNLNVHARLRTVNGFLDLSEFRLNPTLDEIFVNFEGLIGGGEASDLVNEAINDNIHNLLKKYANAIDSAVEVLMQNIFNPTLNTMTISDLINMLS